MNYTDKEIQIATQSGPHIIKSKKPLVNVRVK